MQLSMSKKRLAGALALAVVALTGCKNESPEQMLAQAQQFEKKGEHKAAVIQLKNVLQEKPDDAAARFALGRIYLTMGDHASAEKELQRAIQLGSDKTAALPLLAKSQLLQGKFQPALDTIGTSPANAGLLALRGDGLLALKRLDESRAAYDSALKLAPNNGEALVGLARHALLRNDVPGAVKLADAAIQHNPTDVDALMFRGDLDKAMGKVDSARATYDKALKLSPDAGAAYLQKVYLNIAQEKYDDAKADLAALKRVAPQNLLAYHAQAQLEFTQGQYKQALDSIQKVLRVVPDHQPSLLLAGAIQFALGSLPQAEQHLLKYVEGDGGNVYARKMLASVYLGLGRPADALAQVEAVLPTSEDHVLLNAGGKALMDLKEYARAAAMYERGIKASPDFSPLHVGLGLARMSMGDAEGAIKAMRRGVELSPPKAIDSGIVLGMTYLRTKQYGPAATVINDMLQREPDSALLYNLLGGVRLGQNDRPAARAAFDKAMQLQGAFFTPVSNLARMDITDGKPAGALQRYEAFLAKNPANIEAMIALAELTSAQGKTAEATKWLEKANATNPALPGPGLRLAQQYLTVGEPRKALTLIRAMQVADSANPALLDMLGRVQLANGDKAAALEAYHRLAAIQPRSAAMSTRLSGAYEELGQSDLAADTLRKAQADHPNDITLVLARAAVETRRRNYDQAVLFAREVQERAGSTIAGLIVEAEIREVQGKPDLAIPLYQKAVGLNPNGTPIRIKLGNAHRQAGRLDEAVRLVRQWRTERPNDLALGVYLGELYVAQKQYPAAIDTFNGLLKKLPNNGIVLNNLALAYQAAGDARALPTAELALKALPASPPVMDTLGWLLIEQGNVARGMGLLKQASAADPAAGEIRYHLAAAHARNNDKAAARKELETLLAAKGPIAHAEQARALLKQL